MQHVIMTVGFPASGKSTRCLNYMKGEEPYVNLSRDKEGGSVIDLLPKLEVLLEQKLSVILDCTFMKSEARKPFIEMCQKYSVPVTCVWMATSTEDCQINALHRMMDRHGKVFLDPDSLKGLKDPNMFPISALFKMKKIFEKPVVTEGFDEVIKVKFVRELDKGFTNKALFLDYDGTLRETSPDGNGKYPVKPSEVIARPNAAKILRKYMDDGYRLIGVSNQSGIGKGVLTDQDAIDCFEETNRQLGIDIEYSYCPHRIPPATCYCRKPQAGMAIPYIWKYKLDISKCLMIGDMTSDKTFATRLGMEFIHADEFFKEEVRPMVFSIGLQDCGDEDEEVTLSFGFKNGDEVLDAYYDVTYDERQYMLELSHKVDGLYESMENVYGFNDREKVAKILVELGVDEAPKWW